jgi:hypothetical protein
MISVVAIDCWSMGRYEHLMPYKCRGKTGQLCPACANKYMAARDYDVVRHLVRHGARRVVMMQIQMRGHYNEGTEA